MKFREFYNHLLDQVVLLNGSDIFRSLGVKLRVTNPHLLASPALASVAATAAFTKEEQRKKKRLGNAESTIIFDVFTLGSVNGVNK